MSVFASTAFVHKSDYTFKSLCPMPLGHTLATRPGMSKLKMCNEALLPCFALQILQSSKNCPLSRLFKTKTASQTETKEQRVRKIKYFKKIKQHNKKKEVPRNYQSNRKVSLNEFSFPIHKIHFPSHPHSPLPLLIEIFHATRFFMNPITNTILLVQVGRLSLTAK